MEGEGALRAPRRVHLEALAEGGDLDAEAELAAVPSLDPAAAYLWEWFGEICDTRQSNGMGLSRLSRREIHDWERDEFIALAPWERRTLIAIDGALVRSFNPASTPPTETQQTEETS